MAHKYQELRDKMPPEHRALSRAMSRILRIEIALATIRENLDVGQTDVSLALQADHPKLASIEYLNGTDLASLRAYVEAMGGELLIHARFPTELASISIPFASSDLDEDMNDSPTERPGSTATTPTRASEPKMQELVMSLCEIDRCSKLSLPV